MRILHVVTAFSIGTAAWLSMASAQDYPSRPIRLITAGIGGAADSASRLFSPALSQDLGQQVVVENRGGSPASAADYVIGMPGEGYILLFYSNSLWINPLLQNVSYDVLRDFAPVTLAVSQPNVLVVHPSLPVKSVKDLIALAKAKPGELRYAASVPGTQGHLSTELFKSMAGINIVYVPYKSAAALMTSVIGGETQMNFASSIQAMGFVKSDKLRALAITSLQPSALLPELPTVSASGLPGYEYTSMSGLFASVKTPPSIIRRLNQEMIKVLTQPDMRNRFLAAGVEVIASSPEQFAAAVKSDITKFSKVIKEGGLHE